MNMLGSTTYRRAREHPTGQLYFHRHSSPKFHYPRLITHIHYNERHLDSNMNAHISTYTLFLDPFLPDLFRPLFFPTAMIRRERGKEKTLVFVCVDCVDWGGGSFRSSILLFFGWTFYLSNRCCLDPCVVLMLVLLYSNCKYVLITFLNGICVFIILCANHLHIRYFFDV